MNVFALDFDGVLCDSVAESRVTAWRAGAKLWPGWQDSEPPATLLERYITLRSVVETGYQTILLMGMLRKGLSDAAIASRFPELCEQLLRETGSSREQLSQLFGHTRDEWIAADLQGWLDHHRFYPWVIDRFAERAGSGNFFILTTKEERFVRTLLAGLRIAFPEERIFGLESGKKKEDILEELVERPGFTDATWHFVEDRLATLLRVAARHRLQKVRLYLAGWGYNTPRDREEACNHAAITLWNPDQFLAV